MQQTFKLYSIVLLTGILLFITGNSIAQSTFSASDITKMRVRNCGSIQYQGVPKGYYLLYQEKKLKGQNFVYALQIFDLDLKVIANSRMEVEGPLFITASAANENSFVLKLSKTKEVELREYDYFGKPVGRKVHQPDALDMTQFLAISRETNHQERTDDKALVGVRNGEFLEGGNLTSVLKGYLVQLYSDLDIKWTFRTPEMMEAEKNCELMTVGSSTAFYAVFNQVGQEWQNLKGEKLIAGYYSMVGFNMETGKSEFDVRMDLDNYQVLPMAGYAREDGSATIAGFYFSGAEKQTYENSLGFCLFKITGQGDINSAKFVPWEEGLRPFLKPEDSKKKKQRNLLYFHDIHKTADGRYYLVAEHFFRTFSGSGIGKAMMGGEASALKIVVGDLFVFEMSPDLDLIKVHTVEKNRSNVELPIGPNLANPQVLARAIDRMGLFDFRYILPGEDNKSFTIGMVDKDKVAGENNGWKFRAAIFSNGKFTTRQTEIKDGASSRNVAPGKPGQVLIQEYFKKKKQLDVRVAKY